MRRQANVWAMGHVAPQPLCFPDAEGPVVPEGDNHPLQELLGEEGVVSGRVFDHGTYAEDGLVTWETLAAPRPIPVLRRAGDPSPTHGTVRVHVSSATRHRTSTRIEVGHGKGNWSWGRRRQGVGGLHTSRDVGERSGKLDPAE